MARSCHKCKHLSADMFPMCGAPQRSNQRPKLAYFARLDAKNDCGLDAAWYAPARPSLLYRITQFLRGAA